MFDFIIYPTQADNNDGSKSFPEGLLRGVLLTVVMLFVCGVVAAELLIHH